MEFAEQDTSSELERLERLRSSGTITQSEFDTLKAKALSPSAGIVQTPSERANNEVQMAFEQCQFVGYGGVLALVLGCFAPLVHLPIVGSMNYIYNGRGDGIIVLILTVAAGVLVFLRLYRGVAFATLAIAAVCTFTFVRFATLMADMRRSVNSDLQGNPFRGLADAMVNSVGLDWAWALLIIGIALLMISALMGIRSKPSLGHTN